MTTGHSADGRWWWDGTAWVPAFSPDRSHWWDGEHWVDVARVEAAGRPDHVGTALLMVAAAWSVMLIVVATLVPVSGSTLLATDGAAVLAIVAMPLVAVGVVGASLSRRRHRQQIGAGVVAPVATALVGAVGLLGILTVGPFILPVAVVLAVVCGRRS